MHKVRALWQGTKLGPLWQGLSCGKNSLCRKLVTEREVRLVAVLVKHFFLTVAVCYKNIWQNGFSRLRNMYKKINCL